MDEFCIRFHTLCLISLIILPRRNHRGNQDKKVSVVAASVGRTTTRDGGVTRRPGPPPVATSGRLNTGERASTSCQGGKREANFESI